MLNVDIKYRHLDSFIDTRNIFEHLPFATYFIPECGCIVVYQLENVPALKELMEKITAKQKDLCEKEKYQLLREHAGWVPNPGLRKQSNYLLEKKRHLS